MRLVREYYVVLAKSVFGLLSVCAEHACIGCLTKLSKMMVSRHLTWLDA
jgi:hypothetical protein